MISSAQPVNRSTAIKYVVLRYIIAAFLIVFFLFVFFFRLAEYPAPWFDEGSHLHVAKNFALNGIYADYSSERIRYFGPAVGVGPTILVPIAAAFRVFGVSIPLARIVIVVYGLLGLIAFGLLALRFLSRSAALLSVIVLLLSPGIDYLYHSRTVLGEVPGLFFLLLGLWIWTKPGTRTLIEQVAVGMLMGLACVTKNQYAVSILPAIFLAWIADLVWYRQRGWRDFVVPGGVAGLMFGIWTYIVLIALGESGVISDNLANLRTASVGAFFMFDVALLQKAANFLISGHVLGGLFIPAFLYGVVCGLKRDESGQRFGILMMFIISSTGLFVTSIGWSRYAFGALVIATVPAVSLISDLIGGLHDLWLSLRRRIPIVDQGRTARMVLVIGWLFIVILLPLYPRAIGILREGNGDVYAVGAYLEATVTQDALIETWEPELGIVTNHRYHYPPQVVLANAVAAEWFQAPPAHESYDFRDHGDPDYVVIGPFGKYTGIYPPERLLSYELIKSIGAYDVYQYRYR